VIAHRSQLCDRVDYLGLLYALFRDNIAHLLVVFHNLIKDAHFEFFHERRSPLLLNDGFFINALATTSEARPTDHQDKQTAVTHSKGRNYKEEPKSQQQHIVIVGVGKDGGSSIEDCVSALVGNYVSQSANVYIVDTAVGHAIGCEKADEASYLSQSQDNHEEDSYSDINEGDWELEH